MTTAGLPNWVYDILRDLIEHEDHPELLFTSGAFEGTAKYEWCPCRALEKAPSLVVERARAIDAYLRESDRDKTEPES